MSEGASSKPIEPPEWVSKTLATLDTISGYTFAFLALAGAFVLWNPSPFYGIDLAPLRSSWGGWILGGIVTCLCLAAAKVARGIHAAMAGVLSRRTDRRLSEAAEKKERETKAAAEAACDGRNKRSVFLSIPW